MKFKMSLACLFLFMSCSSNSVVNDKLTIESGSTRRNNKAGDYYNYSVVGNAYSSDGYSTSINGTATIVYSLDTTKFLEHSLKRTSSYNLNFGDGTKLVASSPNWESFNGYFWGDTDGYVIKIDGTILNNYYIGASSSVEYTYNDNMTFSTTKNVIGTTDWENSIYKFKNAWNLYVTTIQNETSSNSTRIFVPTIGADCYFDTWIGNIDVSMNIKASLETYIIVE